MREVVAQPQVPAPLDAGQPSAPATAARYLTPWLVNDLAGQLAAAAGVTWSFRCNESQARRQADFISSAVDALYAHGYVNQPIKIRAAIAKAEGR